MGRMPPVDGFVGIEGRAEIPDSESSDPESVAAGRTFAADSGDDDGTSGNSLSKA